MKLEVKHLLHHDWNGPCIGLRLIMGKFPNKKCLAFVFRIPQRFSAWIITLDNPIELR